MDQAPPSRSHRFMRWVVGHHRLVLGAWVLAGFGLFLAAPPFAEVAVRDPSSFLPSIILVGTFSVLALAPLQGLRHLGVAAASGILIDTFIVRPLLVPAIATMLGRMNWWPDPRWRRA